MDKPVETRRFRITVQDHHWEKDDKGSYTVMVKHEPEEFYVDVTVNWDDIANSLGAKACKSKGGRSQEINGLVAAYRTGRVAK